MEDWIKDYTVQIEACKVRMQEKYLCHPANRVTRKDGKVYGVAAQKSKNVAAFNSRRKVAQS